MRSLLLFSFSVLMISTPVWAAQKFEIQNGQALELKDPPAEVMRVMTPTDVIANLSQTVPLEFETGYDEVLALLEYGQVLIFGSDYKIRNVDLFSGKTLWTLPVGLFPGGAKRVPGSRNKVYFCASLGEADGIDPNQKVGLYELDLKSQKIRPLLTRMPKLPKIGNQREMLYSLTQSEQISLRRSEMTESNSRPFSVCNDLAITEDGKRLYISEPYDAPGASMGGQFSEAEGFMVTQRGHLWKWDLEKDAVSLVAQNFSFVDGIEVLETDRAGAADTLVVTELAKYRIDEFKLGQQASTWRKVLENLPGSPDGLTKDSSGRIWVSLIKERTALLSFAHRFPGLKKILLKLPNFMKPVPKKTGFMVLNHQLQPVLASIHNGNLIRDISAIDISSGKVIFAAIRPQGPSFVMMDESSLFPQHSQLP